MSASIYWIPVKPKDDNLLDIQAPSNFMKALEHSFGTAEPKLEECHIDKLDAMKAFADVHETKALGAIISAINKCGRIKIIIVH